MWIKCVQVCWGVFVLCLFCVFCIVCSVSVFSCMCCIYLCLFVSVSVCVRIVWKLCANCVRIVCGYCFVCVCVHIYMCAGVWLYVCILLSVFCVRMCVWCSVEVRLNSIRYPPYGCLCGYRVRIIKAKKTQPLIKLK